MFSSGLIFSMHKPMNTENISSKNSVDHRIEPQQGYLWKSKQLTERQAQQQDALNDFAQSVSRTGRYLGIPSQGVLISKENQNNDSDSSLNLLDANQQNQQNQLNPVAQFVSKTGTRIGIKPQGWLLERNEGAIKSENQVFDNEQSQAGNENSLLQDYKNYYGVAFGPAFFKVAQSVPESVKTMKGFQQAMSNFFDSFKYKVEHMKSSEKSRDQWGPYLQDRFQWFCNIFVKKINENAMAESQESELEATV